MEGGEEGEKRRWWRRRRRMVLLSNTDENTTAGSRRAPALDNRIYSPLGSGGDQWKRSDELRTEKAY